MTTTESLVRMDEIETAPPSPVRTRRMLAIGAAAIVTVAGFAAVVTKTDQERTPPAAPTSAVSMDEELQDLVVRGQIPRQALQPAPLTRDERLQDLVVRGLIPRQALQPAPLTRDERLQDLVVRGLIPRQALEPAP